jgi:hypothetical protein
MPNMCFSYPAGISSREPRRMPAMCFTYTPEAQRSMPFSCFSYSADVPLVIGNRGAAQQALPGLRRMPGGVCFRY